MIITRMRVAVLILIITGGLVAGGGSLTAWAQQPAGKNLATPGSSAAPDKTGESKRRQQAYLKFSQVLV